MLRSVIIQRTVFSLGIVVLIYVSVTWRVMLKSAIHDENHSLQTSKLTFTYMSTLNKPFQMSRVVC